MDELFGEASEPPPGPWWWLAAESGPALSPGTPAVGREPPSRRSLSEWSADLYLGGPAALRRGPDSLTVPIRRCVLITRIVGATPRRDGYAPKAGRRHAFTALIKDCHCSGSKWRAGPLGSFESRQPTQPVRKRVSTQPPFWALWLLLNHSVLFTCICLLSC
jgi:hypothetical protein